MGMIRFSRELLAPYKRFLVLIVLFQIGQAFLTLYLPTLNAGIIDYGTVKGDIPYVTRVGLLMLALSFVQFACNIAGSIFGARVAVRSGHDLRERVYKKILSLSQREVGEYGAPTLITRATNDTQQIVQFFLFFFTVVINAPIMIIGGVSLALSQNVQLSLVIVITLPLLVVITTLFVRHIVPFYRQRQQGVDQLNGVLRDQITGMRVVRAFNKQRFETDKLEAVNARLFKIDLSIGFATAMLVPLFTLIVSFSKIGLMWLGGAMSADGQVQIGVINAFVTYTSFILSAALMSSMVFIQLPRASVSADRIAEVLGTVCSVQDGEGARDIEAPEGAALVFDHVSFSYAPDDPDVRMVIEDVSFTARPGQTTAIIGSTGSGKTTIVNLISRTANVTDGAIRWGGTDVRDLTLASYLRQVGIVPQRSFLFSGTLEKNLRYAKHDATDEELWEALRIAQAEDFVRASEGQLSMTVAEGGENYSGGQRQRLCIARAIVRKPRIFLFDDSFSALDYATDQRLRAELAEVTKDAICLVVGQRIGSIKDAEQIVVMDEGHVAGIGTHDELMESCAVYQEIVASQQGPERG